MVDPQKDGIAAVAIWACPSGFLGELAMPNLKFVPAGSVAACNLANVRLPFYLLAANISERITRLAGRAFGFHGLLRRGHSFADWLSAFRALNGSEAPEPALGGGKAYREAPEPDIVDGGSKHMLNVIRDLCATLPLLFRIVGLAGPGLFQGWHMKKAAKRIIVFAQRFHVYCLL